MSITITFSFLFTLILHGRIQWHGGMWCLKCTLIIQKFKRKKEDYSMLQYNTASAFKNILD